MNNAQVQNENAVCVVCREGITNPICPECLAKEMKAWNTGISRMLTKPAYGYTTEVKCMFCGDSMSICAHCYCRDVYNVIVEECPRLAEDFLDTFDFGLREEIS